MITKLHIENFQSHRESVFTFDEGINVLIGRSDSGKSAVWRALYWLAFNSPSGEAYRSHWGGDTLVEVWTEDGTHVQRIKTKKENKYVVNGLELKALRTDVPIEVREALGLTDSNFQGQLDASFLLMSSAGEVARVLNEYLDLQSIDAAISSINGVARKNDSALTSLLNEEERQKEILAEPRYEKAGFFAATCNVLEEREEELEEGEKTLDGLIKLRDRYIRLKTSLTPLKNVEKLISKAYELQKRDSALSSLSKEVSALTQLRSRASTFKKKIVDMEDKIMVLEERKAEYLKDNCPVCGSALNA